MAHGSWLMAHGSWLMAHGSWLMAHGSWLMAHGSWLMAHGSWLMAHGSWLMAHGSWLTAHGSSLAQLIVAYLNSSDVVRTGIRCTNKNFPKTALIKQGQNTREDCIKYLVDVILQKFNKSFEVLRLYAKKYRSRNQL